MKELNVFRAIVQNDEVKALHKDKKERKKEKWNLLANIMDWT